MKRFGWAAATATLLGTGGYLLVYVYRWEWHRALLVGVLFLAALVAASTVLLLQRLTRLEQRFAAPPAPGPGPSDPSDPAALVRRRLHEAPVDARPFPWLRPEQLQRTSIFIPVLLGGGIVVSALAWALERVAGRSARAGVEAELAAQLPRLAFPQRPLVPTEAELLASPDGRGTGPDDDLRLLLGPAA